MAARRISLRRLFWDYCEIIQRSQSGTCPSPGCGAPASLSEYGTICLRGHLTDEQGTMPISRTADLALAIVPTVQAMDLQKELALLRELRTDVERWREDGGDARDVGYILDTLDKLEESFPHPGTE